MSGQPLVSENPRSKINIDVHVDKCYTKDQWKNLIAVVQSRAEYVNDKWARQQQEKAVVDKDNNPISINMTQRDYIQQYQEFVSQFGNTDALANI